MGYPLEIYAIVCGAIVLDVISGFLQALRNKTISSTKLRNGAYHKVSYFVVLALSLLIEFGMSYLDLGFTLQMFPAVCAYIVLTEIVSIAENAAKLNPELAHSPIFDLLSSNQKRREEDKDA